MSAKADDKDVSSGWFARFIRAVRTPVLGVYLVGMSILLVYLVYELWPTAAPQSIGPTGGTVPLETPGPPTTSTVTFVGGFELEVSEDSRVILLVVAVGALGSFIHTATSFATFVGNQKMVWSWAWWYLLRPFIGLSLALIFYFAVRGGLLSASADAGSISLFGIAAVSGLVGMFSKQATDKLEELFDTLFKTARRDPRRNKLEEDDASGRPADTTPGDDVGQPPEGAEQPPENLGGRTPDGNDGPPPEGARHPA